MEHYICFNCNLELPFEFPLFDCPRCGSSLMISHDIESVKEELMKALNKKSGMWGFEALLPKVRSRITLGEGNTPLVRARKLGEQLNLKNLFIKDETRNPTSSFIDRGSSVLVSLAKDRGYKILDVMRSGNLAASIAAYASAANMECYISSAEPYDLIKVYQILAYGGKMLEEPPIGSQTYRVSPGDPVLIEGYKTIIFEIYQIIDHVDAVVVPVGSGSLISSIWKGLYELREIGILNEYPRLFGVQSIAYDPIVRMAKGLPPLKGVRSTIASDIIFTNPPRARDAIRAVKDTSGELVSVTDTEILKSMELLARSEGVLAEPSSAAALSGLIRLVNEGSVDESDTVIIVITGSGLKGISGTIKRLLRKTKLLSGEGLAKLGRTKREILKIIASRSEAHGYEIWKLLAEMNIHISRTAAYKHVSELEKMGLLKRKNYGRVVKYSLTADGAILVNIIRLEES